MKPDTAFEWAKSILDGALYDFDPPLEAVKLKVGCPLAEKDHAEAERYYAHAFHLPNTICVAKSFADLQPEHQLGILLHEFGHLYGGEEEPEADLWVQEALGIDIDYVNLVQWVDIIHDES